ncbi:MAG: DUF456 domain-containing protein, partial [bacterium]|nr:DUF456 domain-containing protein [bacterium]
MLTVTIIIGAILLLLGIIGCIVPALPGPPMSFLAVLLLAIVEQFAAPLTTNTIILLAALTVAVTALDYVIPAAGAKKYGSSKWGVWGSIAGMILGALYFPPLGIIVGAFLGAVGIELLIGKQGKQALRAGWGVFV